MGNGIELAKAYVQIVPSAEGIQGKITEVLGGESSKAGDAAGQLLGKKLVGAVAKVISAAGIGKILAESIASGGALQQSLGGVETLFKDSADKVKSYAAQAYKTVGLSANAYMEQTTSFAASLLASVSHDTNAATELANMAMVDMADNANKMGTDMQDIQNAYQGFAKQNYTMLDNLKLGYGGTQAEMQRLLQDAEKISGVHYDLGNLADMYSAIHVIQQEMDITGTTAKEATTTLTGSFSAMSAAFQNVLSSLSTGADLSAPLAALVETSKTYLVDNLLPMVGNVLAGIPEVVYSLVPQLLQSGTELVNSLASGFDEGIPEFFSNALPQLLVFTEQLRANAGSFVDAGLNLITQLLNGLIAGLPQLIAYAPDIIINLAGIINDNMPKILAEGISIVVQLAAGIVQAFPSLLANWKKIFQAILSVISAINWVSLGANILKGMVNITAKSISITDGAGSCSISSGAITFHGIKNQKPIYAWGKLDLFSATTLALDLSSYSAVLITFESKKGSTWLASGGGAGPVSVVLPVNGKTYSMVYPWNTVHRRDVTVKASGIIFGSGQERTSSYTTGVGTMATFFSLESPTVDGWTGNNSVCIPIELYGFM